MWWQGIGDTHTCDRPPPLGPAARQVAIQDQDAVLTEIDKGLTRVQARVGMINTELKRQNRSEVQAWPERTCLGEPYRLLAASSGSCKMPSPMPMTIWSTSWASLTSF
jgi:hypothetical protein